MYFECSSGTGKGNNLIVTCASDFAGITITCTNGVKTYSKVCPSSEPYEIEFSGLESGTWTISGTVEGTLYSTSVVIVDYTATLKGGFDYKTWCTEGGVDATQYSSLADVFDDELAVHRLMTVHASADYLIEAVADDITTIDDFCANDTAMKWIGLRDYVCDGLTAISGVETKFLASEYWERYLKDHVPTMTSNTAPYGTASAYQVFDGSTSTTASATDFRYKFTNPICVKKFESSASGGTLQASNDGSTWITITTPSENTDYYLHYGVHYNASTSVNTIQFYGRSLDVSVPAMTGYTSPYGEVIYSSDLSNQQAYKAFDDNPSTTWSASTVNYDSYIGYRFSTPVVVDTIVYTRRVISGYNEAICTAKIQGSNDGSEWEDLTEILTFDQLNTVAGTKHIWKVTKNKGAHRYHKLQFISGGDRVNPTAVDIQFYGVDYSEREFEVGTNKKWLYDHGLNLENLEAYVVNPGSGDYVTFESDYIDIHYTGVSGGGRRTVAKTSMDLTNYNLAKAVIDDFGASSLNLGVFASDSSTSSIAQADLTKPFNYFDISSVDSNVSVQVGRWVSANTGYGKVKELWLE